MIRPFAAAVAAAALMLCFAADSGAESLYSLRGPGESTVPIPARHRALGGTSVAGTTPGVYGNPALLGFADRTTFTGTYFLDWTKTEADPPAGEDGARQEYAGALTNLSILFPLPRSFVFGTGVIYDRRIEGSITTDASIEGQSYQQVFERDGNLLRFPAMFAKTSGTTRVGAGADFVLFNVQTRWRNLFPSGVGFFSSSDLDRETLWTLEPKAGVRQALGPRLSMGAWASWARELRGNRFLEADDPDDDEEDVKLHVEGDLAPTMALGFEAIPREGWRVALDWNYEAWGGTTPPSSIDELDDVHRFAVGAEWSPREKTGLKASPIRFGFRTEQLAARDAGGRRVRENVLTAGSGFGFSGGSGQFDWAIEGGQRGGDENEFRESFVRFGLTLTGFEKWSKRRPPEEE